LESKEKMHSDINADIENVAYSKIICPEESYKGPEIIYSCPEGSASLAPNSLL
jgi:hypothetical protein